MWPTKTIHAAAVRGFALTAIAATFSLAHPLAQARAVHCVNCATSVQAAAIYAQLQTTNMHLERLVGAIQGSSAANTASTEGSARIMAEAGAQTAREVEVARAAIRYHPMDPCGPAILNGVTGGSGDVVRDRGAAVGRGASAAGGGGSRSMLRAVEIAQGEAARPAPTPDVGAAVAARGACETFAQGGRRAAICEHAGFAPANLNPHPNADIRATTLFDGPQTQADRVIRRLTLSASADDGLAMQSFLRNLDTPIDLRELTAPELRTDSGRNHIALRDSYEARIGVAMRPAHDQWMMMRANPNTLPIVAHLLAGDDGPFVRNYLEGAFPQFQQQGISLLELINLEAERRYRNPDWHTRIAGASDLQLMQEKARMQALQIWMTAQMLERLQHIAIVQGMAAGVATREEMMPQLLATHRAAQR